MRLNFAAIKLEWRLGKAHAARTLYPILRIAIPLAVYAAVLITGLPTAISIPARYDDNIVIIATFLLFYPAYRLSGYIGTLASLSLTLVLFALPLVALWNTGISDGFVVGGLLPWSDASVYYWDARRLLEGGTFSTLPPQRPLFAGVLATLLGLTQQNLQATLAILVAITAIACFFLAREIQRTHGIAAGLLVITTLFLFYRRFIGKTSTENLGLALGAVGFAILWRGARLKQINHCLLGLLIITLALNARAGAFFILPTIILWGAWVFRGTNRFSWRFLLGGTGSVLLGFLLNSLLLKIVGSPSSGGFSNFAYVLYGLIVGGNWTQVIVTHPELNGINEPELSQKIYAIALSALQAHPFGIINGSLRAWRQFLFEDYIFSFIWDIKINFLLQILSLIALFTCYRRRLDYNCALMLAIAVGSLISVPFVPPWDADSMRAYAATIPFFCIVPALGLAFVAKQMEWQWLVKVSSQGKQSKALLIFGIALAIFSFLSPIIIKVVSHKPLYADVICQPGMHRVYVRTSDGSSINLVADNAIQTTHLPNVRLSDFKRYMDGNGVDNFDSLYPTITKELNSLDSSVTIMNNFDLTDWQQFWLVADREKLPKQNGIFGVCGRLITYSDLSTNSISRKYRFFYADLVKSVPMITNK